MGGETSGLSFSLRGGRPPMKIAPSLVLRSRHLFYCCSEDRRSSLYLYHFLRSLTLFSPTTLKMLNTFISDPERSSQYKLNHTSCV